MVAAAFILLLLCPSLSSATEANDEKCVTNDCHDETSLFQMNKAHKVRAHTTAEARAIENGASVKTPFDRNSADSLDGSAKSKDGATEKAELIQAGSEDFPEYQQFKPGQHTKTSARDFQAWQSSGATGVPPKDWTMLGYWKKSGATGVPPERWYHPYNPNSKNGYHPTPHPNTQAANAPAKAPSSVPAAVPTEAPAAKDKNSKKTEKKKKTEDTKKTESGFGFSISLPAGSTGLMVAVVVGIALGFVLVALLLSCCACPRMIFSNARSAFRSVRS